MLKKLIRHSLILSLLVLFFMLALPAQAASWTFTGTIDSSDIPTPECNLNYKETHSFTTTVTGTYTIQFDSANFNGVVNTNALVYAFILDTPNFVGYVSLADASINVPGSVSSSGSVTLNGGQTYYVYVNDCGYIRTVGFYASVDYSVTVTGPDAPVSGSDESDAVQPPDNRINWQYGDLDAVIYEHEDGIVVYCYDGEASLVMDINQELVDNWDTDLPQDVAVLEVNTDSCHVAFYILDTGEYQINIWDREGKLYEIIADNLNFSNPTMRYHDPNE